MASNARIFFAGVGTTFVILAIGFGGGLILAKTAMEPSASSRSVADQPPPVRVILPASAEAAMPPQPPVEPAAAPEPAPPVAVKETQQALEKEKQIERAERRKAEADERARRNKYAERKARREAARLVNRQQEQQPGILAFGGDGDQSRGGAGLFFGN
jgi:outer membrane biosynthesis protein TonB